MKFTIAIPTRNRASLLPSAIKSALNQDFDDYEILISNNHSEDETESVINQFRDPRIRYIRTDRPMSMVDHWNFVMDHVQGEWVIYLCDDDALSPYALKYMETLFKRFPRVEIFSSIVVKYTYPDYKESEGNSLTIPGNLNDRVYIKDTTPVLRNAFLNLSIAFPKVQTSFIKKCVFDRIHVKYGKVFFRWAPDVSNGLLILANTPSFAFVRTPLLIWGENYHSYGRGTKVNPLKIYEFFNEFEEFNGRIEYAPYPGLIAPTIGLYSTFCIVREMLGGAARTELVIDQRKYLKELIPHVRRFIDAGYDNYIPYLKMIESDSSKMGTGNSGSKDFYGEALKLVKQYARRFGIGKRVVPGNNSALPFNNILEATAYINRFFAPFVN